MTKENKLYLLMLFAIFMNLVTSYIYEHLQIVTNNHGFASTPSFIQAGYFFILNSIGALYIYKLTKKTLAYEKSLNINSRFPQISKFFTYIPFLLSILPHLISITFATMFSLRHLITFEFCASFISLVSLSYYVFSGMCNYNYLPTFYACVLMLAHLWYWSNYCKVSIENYKKTHPNKKPVLSVGAKCVLLYTLSFWVLFLTPLLIIYGKWK